MGKNKHIDLFNDMIPAVDQGIPELWDAAPEEGQKEIKGDLYNLNRYISSVGNRNREIQEHYLLTVNEYYNRNWANISKHPKLQWMSLCICRHPENKKEFHKWIPLKKQKNKKEEFLADLFPNMKFDDIHTLSEITTEKEIKKYAEDLGWDKKQINAIKF